MWCIFHWEKTYVHSWVCLGIHSASQTLLGHGCLHTNTPDRDTELSQIPRCLYNVGRKPPEGAPTRSLLAGRHMVSNWTLKDKNVKW